MNAPGENSGQKDKYQQKLDDILSTGLTAENINTYSDDAIDRLVDLIDKIKNDSKYKWDFGLNASSKEQEDEMFNQILGIDVGGALDGIAKIGSDIGRLESIIQKQRQHNQDQMVYIPADKLGYTAMVASNGDFTKSPIVPKTKVALFILENDFGVNLDNKDEFQISTGINTENMMRQVSYDIINLPLLNRAIASCDEIGNRTFVFDTGLLAERGFSLDDIKRMTKQEIQDLLAKDTELGASLFYSKNYPAHLTKLIKEPRNTLAKQIEDNPDQFGQKKQYLKEAANAPEGWVTVNGFVVKHGGVDKNTLRKYIKEKNLESKEYKSQKGGMFQHYREEDLEALLKPTVPEGWASIGGYAHSHGNISEATLGRLIKNGNLEPTEFRSKNGIVNSYYKVDDIDALISDFVNFEKAPEDWITVDSFVKDHETVGRKRILSFIDKSNIESREYKTVGGKICPHYRKEDLESLARDYIDLDFLPEEGWMTLRNFADKYKGLGITRICGIVKQSGLKPTRYMAKNGFAVNYYKEEDLSKVIHEALEKRVDS